MSKSDETVDRARDLALLTERPRDLHAADPNLQDGARSERLREAIRIGGGRVAVATRAGIHPQSLTRYLAGRDAQSATLVAIADACGVSIEWLATGRGDPRTDWITGRHASAVPLGPQSDGTVVVAGPVRPLNVSPGYVAIPRFNVRASAGAGAMTEHPQVVEYISYAEDFLRLRLHRRGEDLGLVEAKGDSMEPTLRDGDILTVDIRPDQAIESGRLYVIQVGDALLVKRVELRLKSIVLHSDNDRYSPEVIDAADAEQLHIVGQVLLISAPPR